MNIKINVEIPPEIERFSEIFEERVKIDGRILTVTRACRCKTVHHFKKASGAGWGKTPSACRFAAFLSLSCCPKCLAKLEWLRYMPS